MGLWIPAHLKTLKTINPDNNPASQTWANAASGKMEVAYVLLWFPLSSETFIFREISTLEKLGVSITIFTMYGKAVKGCSREMIEYGGRIYRMGTSAFFPILSAFIRYFHQSPRLVWKLLRRGLFRKMRNFESLLENTWCFMAGFLLAEKCAKSGVNLIHSAWANGSATAAWVASELTGIPFAFTGRAGDIYPQDGILPEKCKAARFVRTNNAANIAWLSSFCSKEDAEKIRLIYNGLTFRNACTSRKEAARPPYKILAVGRFARTKGFPYLFTAIARLKRENFPVSLTLVGDGSWKVKLLKLRNTLGLEECISFCGFVPNDELAEKMCSHDLLVVPSVVHSNGDRDGIPNVIMEALSMNMPVVATDVCGIGEVIKNGETGLLVPQRNPRDLANAIRWMLENDEAAKSMAEKGNQLVRKMFDPLKNGNELKNLYISAAKNNA